MWLTWIVLPIHYLLQDKRDSAITERLRHAKAFKPVTIKTEKFRKSCRTLWITMISTLRTVQHHVLTPFDISHLGTSLVYISFVVLIKIFAAKPNKPPLCYHLPYMCCVIAMHLCRTVIAMSKMFICLSVCLSVKRMNCDKTKETSAHNL